MIIRFDWLIYLSIHLYTAYRNAIIYVIVLHPYKFWWILTNECTPITSKYGYTTYTTESLSRAIASVYIALYSAFQFIVVYCMFTAYYSYLGSVSIPYEMNYRVYTVLFYAILLIVHYILDYVILYCRCYFIRPMWIAFTAYNFIYPFIDTLTREKVDIT